MSWTLFYQLVLLIFLTSVCVWITMSIWGQCRIEIEYMKSTGRVLKKEK